MPNKIDSTKLEQSSFSVFSRLHFKLLFMHDKQNNVVQEKRGFQEGNMMKLLMHSVTPFDCYWVESFLSHGLKPSDISDISDCAL